MIIQQGKGMQVKWKGKLSEQCIWGEEGVSYKANAIFSGSYNVVGGTGNGEIN